MFLMPAGKNSSTLGVHIENTVRAHLERVAEVEDRSLSYVAARVLRAAVIAEMHAEQSSSTAAVNFASVVEPPAPKEPSQ